MASKLGPRIVTDNLVLALDCADAKSYPGEPTTNFSTNPKFETGTHDSSSGGTWNNWVFGTWSSYNHKIVDVTDAGMIASGFTKALRVTSDGTSNSQHLSNNNWGSNITAGTVFSLSFWGRASASDTTWIYSQWGGTVGYPEFTTEWKYFKFDNITKAASSGSQYPYFRFEYGPPPSGQWFEVTGFQVEAKSYSTPLADISRSAITSFLIHGNVGTSTSFEDSSPNKFTVTNSGNGISRSSGVVKFGSESLNFGSSGTQYLEVSDDDEFHFNTSDFTIEAWIYPLNFGDYRSIYHQGESSGNGYMNSLELKSTGALRWLIRNVNTTVLDINTNASTLTANTWQHIAATREGNYFKLWINGVLSKTSASISTALDNLTYDVHIGNRVIGGTPSYQYYGYMDEVRVTNGTALYTAAFTPSTERFKNGAWLDISGNENNGNFINGVNTGTSHYRVGDVIYPAGTNSARYLDFDGSDQYIPIPSLLNQETINGSTTKTIILWLNADSYGSLMPFSTGQNGANRIYYWTQSSLNTWRIGDYVSTTDHSTLPSAGTWFCTAIVINGLSVTGYLNGVQDYTGTYTAFTTQDFAVLGRHGNLTGTTTPYYYNGKIGQVLVYNKALTATEISNNYNSTKSRFS